MNAHLRVARPTDQLEAIVKMYRERVKQMETAGFMPVQSYNPYWDRLGVTFEDPDGYCIVIQNADWSNG